MLQLKAVSGLFVIKFAPGMPSYSPDKEYIIPLESLIETVHLQKDYAHQYIESIRQLYVEEEKFVTSYPHRGKILIHGFYSSGDQMWYTAFLREWSKAADVHFGMLGLKNSMGIWDGNENVTDLQFPLDKEIFDSYDFIADLRAVTAPFSQDDNRTHVQRYCEAFGVPWLPECDKPEIYLNDESLPWLSNKFPAHVNLDKGRYYVIQMHGQWDTHSFIPLRLRQIAEKLDAPTFFVGFKERGETLWNAMDLFKPEQFDFYPCIYGSEIENNISLMVRELLILVSGAKAVICPDSFLQHAAAAFDIPCVTVYGTHNPERLSVNYPMNKSIYHKEICPHSPCGAGFGIVPEACPTKQFGVCAVVVSVSSQEIVDSIHMIDGTVKFPVMDSIQEKIEKGDFSKIPGKTVSRETVK